MNRNALSQRLEPKATDIRPPAVQQVPRLPRESSSRAAETKERQSVHQTPCRCSKSHACHAKAGAEQRRPRSAKAYIRPPAVQQAPRLPRESSGRAAETKERQSVHQTPCSAASSTPATQKRGESSGDQGAPKPTSDPLQCSKSHACPAKAAAEQRRPRSAKAYIRPPAGAPSSTPATRKQGQSSGDQGAPKRTSDPLQCTKFHACHAKAAAEPSCVMLSCVTSTCVMYSCVMSSCVMSSCVM